VTKDTKSDIAVLDALLKDRDPRKVFDSDGRLGDLKIALANGMLDAEMDHHLD
jgi:hypothetical protein